jgi:hypothetical protein
MFMQCCIVQILVALASAFLRFLRQCQDDAREIFVLRHRWTLGPNHPVIGNKAGIG